MGTIKTDQAREALQHRITEAIDPNNLRLTVSEASAYIPMPKGQLAQLRYTGKGPRFMKPTARTVLYRKGDIDEWLNASVRTSTVEAA
ncbi:hypothetical protein [Bifidobacterium mongoliense]|uniref:helix-turn-helix transcriptional regulator n=1 Tax=Bifidobacterium mongoliense TaxID=518643 RepID=UPI0030EE1301